MIEEGVKPFDGVEAVLRKRERPGSGRGPSVDHAHLYEIEALGGTRKPAARLVHDKPHPWKGRQPVVAGENAGQRIDEDGVEFDASHVSEAEELRRQQVPAATHADDRGT